MGGNAGRLAGYADVSGGRLYYEAAGKGSAVVLIPAYTLDTRMWDGQFDAFAASHRVIRYDLRGAGKSSPPTGPYSHYDDLKALLDFLEIPRAHIVGVSLGGAIAIDFALAHSRATLSLIPVDTSALGGYPWPAELNPWFASISAAAQRGDLTGAKERWLSTGWFAPALKNPDVANRLKRIISEYSGWHFQNKNPVKTLDPPANERLEHITTPTLVVVGELDLPFYNLPIADTLARRIRKAEKLVIPGAGHMANMEDPTRFNQALLAFMEVVDSTNARQEAG